MSRLAFDHELARVAAGRIDDLADSLADGMDRSRPALTPAAAGQDPVSRQAASTFDAVGGSFHESCLGGVGELRKIAANLRAHADLAEANESDAGQAFAPLG